MPVKPSWLCASDLRRLLPPDDALQLAAEHAADPALRTQDGSEVDAGAGEVDLARERLVEGAGRDPAGQAAFRQDQPHGIERELAAREPGTQPCLARHEVGVAQPLEPALQGELALLQQGLGRGTPDRPLQRAGEPAGEVAVLGHDRGHQERREVELPGLEIDRRLGCLAAAELARGDPAAELALRHHQPDRIEHRLAVGQLRGEADLARGIGAIGRTGERALERKLALRQDRLGSRALDRARERPGQAAGDLLVQPGQGCQRRQVDPVRLHVHRGCKRLLRQVRGLDPAFQPALREADPHRLRQQPPVRQGQRGGQVVQLDPWRAQPVHGERKLAVMRDERARGRGVASTGGRLVARRLRGLGRQHRLEGHQVEQRAVQPAVYARPLRSRIISDLAVDPALTPAHFESGEGESRIVPGEPPLDGKIRRRARHRLAQQS